MINQNWIYFGLAIQSWGSLSYLIDTIKGRVQPNKVSWLLWSMAPLIAFFAMIKQGVGLEAWATFIIGFIPLVVFLASFVNKKAKWKIGRLDYICGALSILGLIFWLVTKVGNIAIFLVLWPTALRLSRQLLNHNKEPESEDYFVYATGVINAGIALLIITSWNFQNWSFPLYLLFINLTLAVLIKFKLGKTIKWTN